jgi:2-polyprenyl-6-methoxyphenol hydroxylase-like FAD-dependent oxidoreductase
MTARVVIAGGGPAASAAALRLCALGIQPLLLLGKGRTPRGTEAISEAAMPLLAKAGLADAAQRAGGVLREGFEVNWGQQRSVRRGRWLCLDRAAFAQAALDAAQQHGTEFRTVAALPGLRQIDGGVSLSIDGSEVIFDAAIDATGRSAVWSRPAARLGNSVADLFVAPAGPGCRPMVAELDSRSWYYQMTSGSELTIGIVHDGGRQWRARDLAGVWRCDSDSLRYIGRRPAFPQWTLQPICWRRIAVGDALLAHSPIAGNGVHFALSAAGLAAEVAASWIRPAPERDKAAEFYSDMAHSARTRHLTAFNRLHSHTDGRPKIRKGERYAFSAPVAMHPLRVDGSYRSGECIQLSDGTSVRWFGGIDLLQLRAMAADQPGFGVLVKRCSALGITPSDAATVIGWCVAHEVLTKTQSDIGASA